MSEIFYVLVTLHSNKGVTDTLWRRKGVCKTLTFNILSNDAKQVVYRFQIPKIVIYIAAIIAIIPITLLLYFFSQSVLQKEKISQLTDELQSKKEAVDGLQVKVNKMEEEKQEIQDKMAELNELEVKMREYITELPVNQDSIGGISVEVPDEVTDHGELIQRYKKTIAQLEVTHEELKRTPTEWPSISKEISSPFGLRSDPFHKASSLHTGIDIRGKTGTPVYAGADGTVILAERYGGYGNTIKIKHSDTYTTLYAHLSKIKVKNGDFVQKGEHIGAIGSTGRSTGPHLHYEIIENGEPIDPYPLMNFSMD